MSRAKVTRATRRASPADSKPHALTAITQSSLVRNGYALVASAGVTSVLGIVFWVAAARLYSEAEVGIGGVLISTLITLSSICQLNFANSLNRFVPVAGPRTGQLILFAYCSGIAGSLLLGVAFLLTAERFVPELAFLTADPLLGQVYVASIAVWTIFALQDSALAGLRRAIWVPIENTIYAVAKIVLLVAFAFVAATGLGIFAAWTAPLIVLVAFVNYLIFVRFLPATPRHAVVGDISARTMLRFFGWDYVGGLMMTIAMGVVPILVLSQVGPAASAHYHLAWTITYSLYLIGRSMGISLLAEGSADSQRLPSLVADAVVHTMLPLAGAAIVIALFAPLLLLAFGASYARDGAALLQALALSSIPWGLVTVFLAVARTCGWMRAIALVQFATMALVLGMAGVLIEPLGATGMGLAWLAAHSIVAIGIAIWAVKRGGPDRVHAWLLLLASSAAQFVATFARRRPAATLDPAAAADLAATLAATGIPGAAHWQLARTIPSQGGGRVMALVASDDAEWPRAILKLAEDAETAAGLKRSASLLAQLSADDRLDTLPFSIPRVLATRTSGSRFFAIESALNGIDGRAVLRGDNREAALTAAINAMTEMHRRTSREKDLGQAWLAEWIDEPLTLVGGRGARRNANLKALRAKQREFWMGRSVLLGLGHGDLSPGNILFDAADQPKVAGIVDWGGLQAHAPRGLDACHLLLTTRMLRSGTELGAVVRELLRSPAWDESEQRAANAAVEPNCDWINDTEALRAMVVLAWLRHVYLNLEKTGRYAGNRLWMAYNVDWVLGAFGEAR